MKQRKWPAALLVAVLAALALPANAAAKPGYTVEPRSVSVAMSARATNGYRLHVDTAGHHLVLLTVSKGSVSAEYAVRGTVSRTGVRADFGALGRIAVRFHGSPQPPSAASPIHFECSGKRPIHEVGTYTGTIRFEGEEGFTRFAGHRVKGSVLRRFHRVCSQKPVLGRSSSKSPSGPVGGAPKPAIDLFVAQRGETGHAVSLMLLGARIPFPGEQPLWLGFGIASLTETRGRVSVIRAAKVETDPGSLLVSPAGQQPVTATVTLPKPFSGSGSYSKEGEAAAEWSGTLGVWLPGAGTVPLAGEGFESVYCHASSKAQLQRCARSIANGGSVTTGIIQPAPRPTAQLSGSHSQVLGDARLSWSR